MRNIGLLAFAATTCVLVPTGLHVLRAGPNEVVKLVAPDVSSVQIGGAKIYVTADKGIVEAGQQVRVTLTATAGKPMKIPLTVLVYEAQGTEGSRTEGPPKRVHREEVTLDLDPKAGKARDTFELTLRGRPVFDLVGYYTVLVAAPKQADALERRRRNAGEAYTVYEGAGDVKFAEPGPWDDDPDDDPEHDQRYSPELKDVDFGKIARIDVYTYARSKTVSIVAANAHPGVIPVNVQIKNPTTRTYSSLEVTLSTDHSDLRDVWRGIAASAATVNEDGRATIALGPHETKDVVFHVHTQELGTLGLIAHVACPDPSECESGDVACYSNSSDCESADNSPIGTALNAIDVTPAPEQDETKSPRTAQLIATP